MYSEAIQRMVDFALSKVGCGYIFGATGWICSKARREQQAEQYKEYAGTILGIGAKWDGKECYDCAQLTKKAVEAAGGALPSGANSQWLKGQFTGFGPRATMPDTPCLLYKDVAGSKEHTGIYIGDGWVVDARGTSDGVIKTRLDSYNWTHWAMPMLIKNEGVNTMATNPIAIPCTARIVTKTGNGLSLWEDNTKKVQVCFVPENAVVTVLSVPDAKGFSKARYEKYDGVKAKYEKYEGVIDAQYFQYIPNTENPLGTGTQSGIVPLTTAEAEAVLRMVSDAQRMLADAQSIIRARMGG
ncbi:MAG: NlpC/P60 family protein [Firmicutes bacterium]|nr:NlpC/P60 family protein [Bacillota bacterium]